MVADRPGHQDRVARPGLRHAEAGAHQDADTGGVDVDTVGLAALHDLRVTGDDLDVRGQCRVLHRVDDLDEVLDRKSFLQDETGREVARPCPGDGQVVHRAVDRERPD